MMGIQILSVTFIFLMLYVVRIHYKKGELPKVEAIFWASILFVVGILVMVSQSADYIRRLFAVTRLTDVIVIFSFMGVFVLLIENRIQINKLRTRLERLVRDRAMDSK
ncbi:hypothetical protein COT54_01305 [Candidatus Collierbacteria bacterium CG09_land_8_20_14_0_10_46_12]|uniref:DUF2304 domain-containing protein n=1 Tax=Candidatus Collierbacteria bacterium CG09_land_8_20_14_0_10_46_12 TaxID=1974533 RepID=A0A2H0WZI2_9BACT|nr:MAG: hypothetical protein COT54_01305 [Candidatus Collierbacteria bacterium CG09_land_8_20_14_0_10_46_12]